MDRSLEMERDAALAGGTLPQLSTSYFNPRSLATYEDYMRVVDNEGRLEVKREGEWDWKVCYCALKNGTLQFSEITTGADSSPLDVVGPNATVIPLEIVASVRTADQFGDRAFQIVTPEATYFFAAPTRHDMQEWLFAFHRSLAVIVARLVDRRSMHPPGSQANARWLQLRCGKELGHGHGRPSVSMARRFRQTTAYDHRQTSKDASSRDAMKNKRDTWAPDSFSVGPQAVQRPHQQLSQTARVGGTSSPMRLHITVPDGPPTAAALSTTGSLAQHHRPRGLMLARVEMPVSVASGPRGTSDPSPREPRRGRHRFVSSSASSISVPMAEEVEDGTLGSRGLEEEQGGGTGVGPSHDSGADIEPGLGFSLLSPLLPSPSPTSSSTGTARDGRESQAFNFSMDEQHGDDGHGLMFEMSMEEAELAGLAAAHLGSSSGASLVFATNFSSNSSSSSAPRAVGRSDSAQTPLAEGSLNESHTASGGYMKGPSISAAGMSALGAVLSELEADWLGDVVVVEGEDEGGGGANGDGGSMPNSGNGGVQQVGVARIRWTAGATSLQGIRDSQEDQFTVINDLNGLLKLKCHEAQAFYAIYDGHCGAQAACYAKDILHHYLVQDPGFVTRPDEAMTRTCRRIDREVLEMCTRERLYCGTTAIMALVRGRRLLVGNVGDCAAVLCRGRQAVAISKLHTPGREDETDRIVRAGGWITTERELFMGQLHRMDLTDPSIAQGVEKRVKWVTITRVCGELSVSRSFGDPDFKGFAATVASAVADGSCDDELLTEGALSEFPFNFPDGHSGRFRDDLIIADPEFVDIELREEDPFMVVACDGFWDVVGYQEAVDHTLAMFESGSSIHDTAKRLGDLALRLGSSDNVTVLLVSFQHG